VQTLERAAMLAPDDVGIRTRLAAARLATGDAAGTVNDLEYALKVAPTPTDVAEGLVTAALALGDIDKALFALDLNDSDIIASF
jgi:hypothetical protein